MNKARYEEIKKKEQSLSTIEKLKYLTSELSQNELNEYLEYKKFERFQRDWIGIL